MGLKFLLDTNVVSEPARPSPNPALLARLAAHASECAIASVTWHELVYGVRRLPVGRRRDALEEYLLTVVQASFPVLAYDTAAAEWHGRERARLTSLGGAPAFADGQIAAVAKAHGLVVVTANVADMRVFDGVEVVSWLG